VAVENRRPGTRAWRLGRTGAPSRIEGYADRTAVDPGERFGLYVTTTAPRWQVTAYRIGYYGATGARQVWRSGWQRGTQQPAAVTSAGTRTVRAPWHRSLLVRATGWPPGAYLLKLHSSEGYERYVPIMVHSATFTNAVVIMSEYLMFQAYNDWGGRSLYTGPGGYAGRSYAVSFDRPYQDTGAEKFTSFELPLIYRAERLGLPLAYLTDIDVDTHPWWIAHARALISPGHDEYWTMNERNAVLAARDHGANVAFFGANAEYWQVRLGNTPLGNRRLVICYKTSPGLDPRRGTQLATTLWRQLPRPLPERLLIGLMYACFPAEGAFTVTTPTFWAYAGTGARAGTRYPGLIGPEIDHVVAAAGTPRPIQVIGHSKSTCGYSDAAYYTAKSRAGVFATGTMRWVIAMGAGGSNHGVDAATVKFVQTVTDNVLRAFAAGPAGLAHPAVDNLRLYG
jgi:hypothetical protein